VPGSERSGGVSDRMLTKHPPIWLYTQVKASHLLNVLAPAIPADPSAPHSHEKGMVIVRRWSFRYENGGRNSTWFGRRTPKVPRHALGRTYAVRFCRGRIGVCDPVFGQAMVHYICNSSR
jgi:hypothetical protein